SLVNQNIYSIQYDLNSWNAYMDGANLYSNGTNTVDWSNTPKIGYDPSGAYYSGVIEEILAYNTALPTNAQALSNQYQSARWGIALTPPGTGATEAAKAMASDGYSSFTTRYLERLSQSADIALQATNSITLDLKGDTLALANDRSLSLTTT